MNLQQLTNNDSEKIKIAVMRKRRICKWLIGSIRSLDKNKMVALRKRRRKRSRRRRQQRSKCSMIGYKKQQSVKIEQILAKGKWLDFEQINPEQLPLKYSQILPVMPSIDQLFSASSHIHLTSSIRWSTLLRHLQLINFSFSQKCNSLIVHKQMFNYSVSEAEGRQSGKRYFQGLQINAEERQTLQRYPSFMEKLKISENKYHSSIKKMTNVSKELAFNYRVYLEQRTQIINTITQATASHRLPSQTMKLQIQYAKLLIRKNIVHALHDRTPINLLNYFSLRQKQERNITYFKPLVSENSFHKYLAKRRPKRFSRYALLSACSICFSDHSQLANPINFCSSCHTRCHLLCFNFKENKCGNCLYKKMRLSIKETVGQCLICGGKGGMIIKTSQERFYHGFCLIVHGFWMIKPRQGAPSSIQYSTQHLLTALKSQQNQNRKQFLKQYKSIINYLDPPLNIHQLQPQSSNYNKVQICIYCEKAIIQSLGCHCDICDSKYHIFCGYFQGNIFKLDEKSQQFSNPNFIRSSVCCNDISIARISTQRRFKLNHNKFAYEISSAELLQQNDIEL